MQGCWWQGPDSPRKEPAARLELAEWTSQATGVGRVVREMSIMQSIDSPLTLASLPDATSIWWAPCLLPACPQMHSSTWMMGRQPQLHPWHLLRLGLPVRHRYQNAASIRYLGFHLSGSSTEQQLGAGNHTTPHPALAALFQHEPGQLHDLLEAVAAGRTWRRVVRVPPPLPQSVQANLQWLQQGSLAGDGQITGLPSMADWTWRDSQNALGSSEGMAPSMSEALSTSAWRVANVRSAAPRGPSR